MAGTNRVQVKICGITREADAALAASLGANAIGLNFYAPSPRSISLAGAHVVLRALPSTVEAVAVFVKETAVFIARQLQSLPGLNTVQWHADPSQYLSQVPFQLTPAFAVESQVDLENLIEYLTQARERGVMPKSVLVDARVPGLHGGTGKTAAWHLLADFHPGVPIMLAGGLTADNVAAAIRIVKPFAVDVASGVESSPGVKDPEKLRRFMSAVRWAHS
jgi:phosphoribosylanthranilate isomerase